MNIRVEGKQFATESGRFAFRGVTYGTFRPRPDGQRFPPAATVARDFAAIAAAGFTVVRTYTPPPEDVLHQAGNHGLRLMSDVFYPDWRYLVGSSRAAGRRLARMARAQVRAVARRLAGSAEVAALSLGNEIPADVVRWAGARRVAATLAELAEVAREEDPGRLITYANYPTAEYLPLETLDFLTFNVFLENRAEFRRYLTRLHHLAGDRPLVLGEIGMDAGPTAAGEERQAAMLDELLETALERGVAGTCLFSWTDEWWVGEAAVEGWSFGLTRADRSPRPALRVAQRWNARTIRDLDFAWPSLSVVICAYNAEATLDECLRHTCALDYPGLEIIVVDDGSTDATVEIARRYGDRVRLLEIDHGGLSVARNEGYVAARGKVVAYLDSDAYPVPEWPYYLALGFDRPSVGGVGGPNIVPTGDPRGAQQVARAPGGPMHVLTTDDRAEHIPGCNMAFWRDVLEEVGGFDPVCVAAGDDVDLCWRVLDRRWEIGFHPAAVVWHHRRPGLRTYLRQQRGYGRAEALVKEAHPARFTGAGSARWRGHIYTSFAPRLSLQRVYRGAFGTAAYQSVYRGGGYSVDIAHQIGLPLSLAVAPLALLAVWWPLFAVAAAPAGLMLALLFGIDLARADVPRNAPAKLRFKTGVAVMNLLQPLARIWGRNIDRPAKGRRAPGGGTVTGPIRRVDRATLMLPADRPRAELVAGLVRELRRSGLPAMPASEWDDYDARVPGSALFHGRLVTSEHPVGCVQLRVRPRLRPARAALAGTAVLAAAAQPAISAVLLLIVVADLGRGLWRIGRVPRRILLMATDPATEGLPLRPETVSVLDA